MSLAYLSNFFPSLSETFIYREVLELKRRKMPVRCYSLRRPVLARLSQESVPLYEETFYLLPVPVGRLLAAHLSFLFGHPVKYFSCFVKMLCGTHHKLKDRWRSLMHFGEGVALARRMRQDGITHIHAQFASQSTSVARVVSLLTGIPYSFSAHAHDIWHDRILLPEKLQEARFVACCSQCGKNELIAQGRPEDAGKVHLVYHGIDVRRFTPPADGVRKDNLLLAVGRFESVKGFPNLVKACLLLKEQGVKFRCRIIGDGDEKELVTAMVQQHDLQDVVELPGAMTQEQLLAHYHEASVFVLPCIPDGTRHDGIPNVLAEAMATGLPLVTTPVGGILELVTPEKDTLLVKSGQVDELAATLGRILEDKPLRLQMGAAAHARVADCFDNRKTIEPLLDFLGG